MRTALAVILGFLAGLTALVVTAYAGDRLFPTPAMRAAGGPIEQATAALANAPTGALVFIALSWLVGGLVAGAIGKWFSGKSAGAWGAVAVLTVLTVSNIFIAPFPVWLEIASVAAPLIGGLIGNHLAPARAAPPGNPA